MKPVRRRPGGLAVSCLLLPLVLGPGVTARAAVVNQPEGWAGATKEGWRCLDQAAGEYRDSSLELTNGTLRLVYPARSPVGARELYAIEAQATASSGCFSGSWFDPGVTALAFDFYCDAIPELSVSVWNSPEFLIYEAAVTVQPGWQRVVIPLDLTHFRPPFGGPSDAEFRQLLGAVDMLWINVRRAEVMSAQEFRIDNVELTGPGAGYGAWVEQFAGAESNRWPGVDWDGDGAANGDEFLADTAPNDAVSRLALRPGDEPFEVGWTSSSNRVYDVLRRTNLVAGAEVTAASALSGTGSTRWYVDAVASNMPTVFYRLRARLP